MVLLGALLERASLSFAALCPADLCVGVISLQSQCPELRIFFPGFSALIIPRR